NIELNFQIISCSMKNRGKKHHVNTLRRIRLVCEIVQRHYEPGNYAKSYFKVWKNYVNPIYPCCYRTLLNYINTPLGDLKQNVEEKRQLKLFDNKTEE
ncbi:MAG: hypothetical protein LUF04_13670, partial [Bacteroides sp.]|nr:hypothetical protein [Bacteroides sp.]